MMRSHTAIRQAREHLALLIGAERAGAMIEVRYRARDRAMRRLFIGSHARHAARTIAAIGQRTDVFVGCAPRDRRAGGKDAITRAWALWADCDAPEAVEALQTFTPAPSRVVASGSPGNCHAYWALSAPLDTQRVQEVNGRLAAALGADPRCADAARILRVPGTLNFKHDPPRPVAVLHETGERYAPDLLLDQLPEPSTASIASRSARDWRAGDPLLTIAPSRYVEVLLGRTPGRDGKISCPFHEDRTPSLHVYETSERGWRCYGRCGRGGSIYDLAGALWQLDVSAPAHRHFPEVRRRLSELFAGDLHRVA